MLKHLLACFFFICTSKILSGLFLLGPFCIKACVRRSVITNIISVINLPFIPEIASQNKHNKRFFYTLKYHQKRSNQFFLQVAKIPLKRIRGLCTHPPHRPNDKESQNSCSCWLALVFQEIQTHQVDNHFCHIGIYEGTRSKFGYNTQ